MKGSCICNKLLCQEKLQKESRLDSLFPFGGSDYAVEPLIYSVWRCRFLINIEQKKRKAEKSISIFPCPAAQLQIASKNIILLHIVMPSKDFPSDAEKPNNDCHGRR